MKTFKRKVNNMEEKKMIKELEIETKHLILRKAKFEDLNSIWKNIWSDKRIAENMLWEVTTSLEEAKKRMERTIKYQSEHYAYFVCLKTNDKAIGFCGVNEQEKGYMKKVESVLRQSIKVGDMEKK